MEREHDARPAHDVRIGGGILAMAATYPLISISCVSALGQQVMRL
jgi:hypothetical protein